MADFLCLLCRTFHRIRIRYFFKFVFFVVPDSSCLSGCAGIGEGEIK